MYTHVIIGHHLNRTLYITIFHTPIYLFMCLIRGHQSCPTPLLTSHIKPVKAHELPFLSEPTKGDWKSGGQYETLILCHPYLI